ncbi:RICIN domain-containing protein [Actinoplanes sp. TRM 88003]|uniref:RICIN domain-containing protein n=1 Tax=Paractinoplanes aksuensis TaxID=2939490 RepID=A0ABT1E326_9ACTN|nr:RICIN domain-containing protein [Actinoplanes aksuensis]MCO8276221.1 RICIN domain-containing protein [Actinoplanes aksuensis]
MVKRVTTALLLLTMAVASTVTAGPPAQARTVTAEQAQAAELFRIRNVKSGLYLQNAIGSISNGVAVAQYPRSTDGYQYFQEVVDGQYRSFMHVKSGRNIGINIGNPLPGAKAILANGSAAYNQDWLMVTRSGTIVELRNRNSGLCLGIYDASTQPAAVAAQFACDGGANQGWQKIFVV